MKLKFVVLLSLLIVGIASLILRFVLVPEQNKEEQVTLGFQMEK